MKSYKYGLICRQHGPPKGRYRAQGLRTARPANRVQEGSLRGIRRHDGQDFHSSIAKMTFGLTCAVEDVAELYPKLRQASKAISFGILYGAGARKVSDEVNKQGGNLSVREAQRVIDDYFRAFPKLKKWIDDNIDFIEKNAFIYSTFGRKRRLPNVKSKDRSIQGHEVRSGLNFLVQSVASDINLLGAIDAHQELKSKNMGAKIFALVHDSILAEVPDEEVDAYTEIALRNLQKDRGVSIPNCPVGCDVEVAQDYSGGKFEKQYLNAA